MSISHAINAAQSGLRASGVRADIVATNVANASTPGYVRRSVLLSETIAGTASTGVQASGIGRSADAALTAQRRSLSSDVAQASVMSSTWETLSARLGDTSDGTGLFAMMSGFESALKAAALSPESTSQANATLTAALTLVNEFQDLSALVSSQRAEADGEIASGVDKVNAALKQIEALNGRISGMNPASSQTAVLMDERDRVLDTIAEYLPVQAVARDRGTIDIVTTEGVYLLSGKARQIEFSPANAFGPNQTLASGSLSGLSVDGIDITPGSASYGAISSGLFGALVSLRDNDLPGFGQQLDAVAADLVTRLSADSIDPTKTAGAFGLFVDPNPAAGAGLAGRIQVNALVDPAKGGEIHRLRDGLGSAVEGPPGNSSILSAMVDSMTSINAINTNGLRGNFTATELVGQFASTTGQARVSYGSVLSSSTTQFTTLAEAEQGETGVDVDAQMQELMLIEQAYAANARVIEIANDMLSRLMEI